MKTFIYIGISLVVLSGCARQRGMVGSDTIQEMDAAEVRKADNPVTVYKEAAGIGIMEQVNSSPDVYYNDTLIVNNTISIQSLNNVKVPSQEIKIQETATVDDPQDSELPMNKNAVLGFMLVLFGLIPIVGHLVGLGLCFKALQEIKKNPGVYRGKKLAIAGIILFFSILLIVGVSLLFLSGVFVYNQ